MNPRLVRKITETHLNPNTFQRQNVALAAQLLSTKVAAGMLAYTVNGGLPPDAMYTARFCQRIDELFQTLNGVEVSKEEESVR